MAEIILTAANLSRRCFMAKLGTMRKAQEFIVYPRIEGMADDTVVVQSDKSIARVNLTTGSGKLFQGKGEHPSFFRLQMYGKACVMPSDVVDAIRRIVATGK